MKNSCKFVSPKIVVSPLENFMRLAQICNITTGSVPINTAHNPKIVAYFRNQQKIWSMNEALLSQNSDNRPKCTWTSVND